MSCYERNLHRDGQIRRNLIFVLADGFSMHSFSCLTEPLDLANRLSGRALYTWALVSENGLPVCSSTGIEVPVAGALHDTCADDFVFVCDSLKGIDPASKSLVAWLRRHKVRGGTIGSLGNGGYTLAQAGLLDDRRFTIHWHNRDALQENYPWLDATGRIYEIDRRIITCAGGAAATDLALAFIARDVDVPFSRQIAERCLQPGNRSQEDAQRSPLTTSLSTDNAVVVNVVSVMRDNLENPVDMCELADRNGISRRQIERLFRKCLGASPARFYQDLRLARSRELIVQTDLSIAEIACACGYNSIGSFNKNFRKRYGCTPLSVRCPAMS